MELVSVREWRTGPTPMPGDPGAWDLKAIARWRCDRLKGNVNQKSKELVELEIREKQADVQKKELGVRKQRGDLVSRIAVKGELANVLNEARLQLEAVPGVIASRVPTELRDQMREEWEQQIAIILRTMSSKAESIGDSDKP